jgi:ABC-2 type transport system ATP-binding protein
MSSTDRMESAPDGRAPVLLASNVSKRYGDTVAVANLNLQVGAGDVYCLLGPNGAGKTTTINLFLNFVSPSAGSVTICGLDVTRHSTETKRHLAYIPEQVMLYRNLTGLENLEYFSSLAGGAPAAAPELLEVLADVGLPHEAATRRVRTYSKGMRQKVGIAIAIAKQAEALLLDEPTSGLDPKASNEFSALLERVAGNGAAVLMATHDLFRAKETGTRIGIMKYGSLVREFSTEAIGHADLERIYLEHMHD